MKTFIDLGTENDIEELEQLYNDLIAYLVTGMNYPGWKKDVYPTRIDAEKGIHNRNLYTAKHDGKIIGTIILSHEPEPAYKEVQWKIDTDYNDIFVIHTLAVHPLYLKAGIGKKLIDFSIEQAVDQNIKSLRLDVYEKNLPAIHLYEKCGFQYIATVDLGYGEYGLDWFKLYEMLV